MTTAAQWDEHGIKGQRTRGSCIVANVPKDETKLLAQ